MTHSTGSVLVLERQTIHVSDPPTALGTGAGRIAMLEKRTVGTDDAAETLTRYIYSNHLQSASLELDEEADIISYEEYHPYGTTAFQAKNASINAVAKRYRYTGKERDEESGLYYHGARYYIPWLCRWTAIDPMESKYAGMNPYNYSFNNPIMFNDPSGADPGKPPIDGEKLQGPSSYRGENGIIIEEPARVELEGVTVKPSDDGTSAGILGGHGLNIWQAAAMQQAANDPEQQAAFARSRERGASIETAVNIQLIAGSSPLIGIALFEAAPIAISTLQTAGAASASTSTSVASYSGSGAATLTMGSGSGAIGAGGFSSGVTWAGVAKTAEGVHTLNMAYLAASEAATAANTAVAKKTKEEESDFASVRLQVQTGKENISSDVQINTVDIGVTKAQGYLSLSMIYSEAILIDPTLKHNKDFRAAIIKMSEKINAVKGGLIKGTNQTTLQEIFYHQKKQYRVDLEVQRGLNFKQ